MISHIRYEILPKQREIYSKYCKILQWGRQHPTRFLEQFLQISFSDYQKWVFLNSWIPKVCVWVMSRSSGKCNSLRTFVRRKKTLVHEWEDSTIGELRVGDYVMDENNNPVQVIELHPIVFENVYNVLFDDGEVIECNGEHLWKVSIEKEKWEVIETQDIFRRINNGESFFNCDGKAIINIEKTEDKIAMRCITVNSETGLYKCGKKGTVTHNSFLSSPLIMARSLLFPNHNTYIMAPSGSQSMETFTKMEKLAKGEIASVLGVSSFFLDECVRANSTADPFTHNKSGYAVSLYNGSTVNSLNSVATNIVGIRSKPLFHKGFRRVKMLPRFKIAS